MPPYLGWSVGKMGVQQENRVPVYLAEPSSPPAPRPLAPNQAMADHYCYDSITSASHDLQALLQITDRETLLARLAALDPNGTYTDSDSEAEGFDPMSLEEAQAIVREWLNR